MQFYCYTIKKSDKNGFLSIHYYYFAMLLKPIFSIKDNTIYLPWRDYLFSNKNITIITLSLASLIILCGLVDNIEPSKYLMAASIYTLISPFIFYFLRYWYTEGPFSTPLLINMSGIKAPTPSYKSYIPWSQVTRVEYVWSTCGPNMALLEKNLIVYKNNGSKKRMFTPSLTLEEKEKFSIIFNNISKHHKFDLIIH